VLASRLAQLATGCAAIQVLWIIFCLKYPSHHIRSAQELVVALSQIQQRLEDENTDSPQLIIVDSLSAILVDADSNMMTRIENWMK
jgi:hypothetical protein